MLKHRWSLYTVLGLLSALIAVGMVPQGIMSIFLEREHADNRVTQRNLLYTPEARAIFERAKLPVGPHTLIRLGEKEGMEGIDEYLLAHAEHLRLTGEFDEATYAAIANVTMFYCSLWPRSTDTKAPYRLQAIAARVLDPRRVLNGELAPWVMPKTHLTLPSYGVGWVPFGLFFVLLIPKLMALRLGWWLATFAYCGRNGVHQGDIITEVRVGWRSILAQVVNIFSPLPIGAHAVHGEARFVGGEAPYGYHYYVGAAMEALFKGRSIPPELCFTKAAVADYQNFGFLARLLGHFIATRVERVAQGSQRLAAVLHDIVRDNGHDPSARQVTPLGVLRAVASEVFANPSALRHSNVRFALVTTTYAASMLFFANLLTLGAREAQAADSAFLQLGRIGQAGENLFLQLEHDGSIAGVGLPYSLYLDHTVGTPALAVEASLNFPGVFGVGGLSLSPVGVAAFDFSDGPNLTMLKAGGKAGYTMGDMTIFLPGFWNFTQDPRKPDFFFANPRVVHTVTRFGEGGRLSLGAMLEGIGSINTRGVTHASGGAGPFLGFPGGHVRGSVQVPFGADAGQDLSGLVSTVIPIN